MRCDRDPLHDLRVELIVSGKRKERIYPPQGDLRSGVPVGSRDARRALVSFFRPFVLGLMALAITSCSSSKLPVSSTEALDAGWPKADEFWHETSVLPADWMDGKQFWYPANYAMLRVKPPWIEGAAFVGRDDLCATCHESYVKAFANNVHRTQRCEACHGPASLHLETRGEEPRTILRLKDGDFMTMSGKPTDSAERSEVCLQCH